MTISRVSHPSAPMLLGRDGAHPLPAILRRRAALVGRSRSAYRWFPYPAGVTPADARNAAGMAARSWSPFPEAGLFLVAGAAGLSAWAWNPDGADQSALPATLAQSPASDGRRLLRQPDGYEAQSWRAGELRASAWWPMPPGAADWVRFQRSAGVAPQDQTAMPQAIEAPWVAAPWGQRWIGGANWLPPGLSWLERAPLFGAIGVAAALMIGFFGADAARVWLRMNEAEGKLRQESAAFVNAGANREVALALSAQIQPLSTAAARRSPLALMAGVAAALPEEGVRLIDWFQQPSDLNATMIVTRPLDGAALVRRLEAIPAVAGVTLDGAGGSEERVVRLRLTFAP